MGFESPNYAYKQIRVLPPVGQATAIVRPPKGEVWQVIFMSGYQNAGMIPCYWSHCHDADDGQGAFTLYLDNGETFGINELVPLARDLYFYNPDLAMVVFKGSGFRALHGDLFLTWNDYIEFTGSGVTGADNVGVKGLVRVVKDART